MMFKKILALVLVLVLALSFAACANKPVTDEPVNDEPVNDEPVADDAAEDDTADKSAYKAAFILAGPISDMSWNYTTYLGSEKIKEAGYEVVYQENTDPSNLVESVRTFADAGYNCIFLNTDANQEDVVAAAADYPDIQVFICNGANVTDNVYPLFFSDADQGFVMGAAAAAITKTNKVAYLAGIDFVPLTNGGKGFIQGAKFVNPDIEVEMKIIGTTDDAGMAKETALALYNEGYDVLAPNADAASLGVMEAAGEVEEGMAIATGDGMISLAPDSIPMAVTLDTSIGYYAAFMQFVNDEIPEAPVSYGVAQGLVADPVWNDEFTGEISEEAKTAVQKAFDALKNAEIAISLAD